MTSEILIMNKEAIALAADSAASLNDVKIFKANKIFTLSKYAPVAIMIYGNSLFNNIPWETVIKEFRKTLDTKKFDTLQEYANEFLKFLTSSNGILNADDEKYILLIHLNGYYQYILDGIKQKVTDKIAKSQNHQISDEEVMIIASQVIDAQITMWENSAFHENQDADNIENFIKNYRKEIDAMIDANFEKIAQIIKQNSKYSKIYENVLKITACNFLKFSEEIKIPDPSGIVIAGFGEKEKFPSFHNYLIWLKIDNCLKMLYGPTQKVTHGMGASIQPFAQTDMVDLFMSGIDPKYQDVINSTIADFFQKYPDSIAGMIQQHDEKEREALLSSLKTKNEEIFTDFIKKMKDFKRQNNINPILDVVKNLPRNELADMAESLISLTSFKKRVTMQAENVGGPIDVAVITKGDGFIWIKRKNYFKPELNPQFFANYYDHRQCNSNGDSK